MLTAALAGRAASGRGRLGRSRWCLSWHSDALSSSGCGKLWQHGSSVV